jgi:serine/threonine protein kinase
MADSDDFDFSESPTNPTDEPSMSRMIMPGSGEHSPRDPFPERIGKYRILGQIGHHGGMGVVLKASLEPYESDPLESGIGKRQVAIKLIRRGTGMRFEDSLARFKVECSVLNSLDHPNIARFIEAGETSDGDPYFVMEYVEGQSVTDYCDANNLSVRERLTIFRKVCAAVQFAHSNLVVHRDIKPENILVTPRGEPKLLDFGIAKLLNPQMAAAVAVTGPMMQLMTPEYASPEQVSGGPINTLSDIYSLGVLLYELLTGQRPYDIAKRIEAHIKEVICETEPIRPSTAVTRASERRHKDGSLRKTDPVRIAERRSARPDLLKRQLSGDLDDIVLVAMSKAPAQRFKTAEEMADEVGRHLEGHPIQVRRIRRRALYVGRKFARRHRTPLAIGAASLVLILAASSWAIRADARSREDQLRADTEALRADLAEAENASLTALADATEARADAEAARAESKALELRVQQDATAKVFRAFLQAFGNRSIDVGLTAIQRKQLWDEVTRVLGESNLSAAGAPANVQFALAQTREEIGDALGESATGGLGATLDALEEYRSAEETYARLLKEDPGREEYLSGLADVFRKIAGVHIDLNRSDQALELLERASREASQISESGPLAGRRRALLTAISMEIGEVHLLRCEIDQAIEVLTRSLRTRQAMRADYANDARRGPVATRFVFMCQGRLGAAMLSAGRITDAQRFAEQSLALRKSLVDGDVADERQLMDVAVGEYGLAKVLATSGQFESALTRLDRAGATVERLAATDTLDASLRGLQCSIESSAVEALLSAEMFGDALRRAQMLLDLCDALERDLPESPRNREYVALSQLLYGEALLGVGELSDARTSLADASKRFQELKEEDPGNVNHQRRLAQTAISMGDLTIAAGESPEVSRRWFLDARGIYDELGADGRLCGVPGDALAALASRLGE